MFGLLRGLRRRRLLKRPFPTAWLPHLERRVPFFGELPPGMRERFLDLLKVFVWEKHFIGAGGMEIDDEVKVVIAATAVRLVLHLDLSYYDRLTEIVVYPAGARWCSPGMPYCRGWPTPGMG
jgi:Mlc titration factor MtfA (ptsG expression regulator)